MTQPELNSTKIDKRVLGASMQTTVYFKLDMKNETGSFQILLHKAMKQEYFQTYCQKIEYEEPIYANPSAHSKS